ncbi:hypothetical protein TUM4261_22440 [Shewanella sp. c952]|nr:hypothetical protein TUM4261_22440 [Shewanella sp. c952]
MTFIQQQNHYLPLKSRRQNKQLISTLANSTTLYSMVEKGDKNDD